VSHFRSECKHGVLVDQCRCPGPAKYVDIVSCAKANCHQVDKVPDSEIRRIAENIIISHTEDIEYLTVAEMTSGQLEAAEWPIESDEELDEIYHRVDAMIEKARVTVKFED
jgi:hypothetical protein